MDTDSTDTTDATDTRDILTLSKGKLARFANCNPNWSTTADFGTIPLDPGPDEGRLDRE